MLATNTGLVVATQFNRIEHGGRGDYYEFEVDHLRGPVKVPSYSKWRFTNEWRDLVYYLEYRTIDTANVKLYLQLKPVYYAHYIVGKLYVSTNDVTCMTNGKETT